MKYKICVECKDKSIEGTICRVCKKFCCHGCDESHLFECAAIMWTADEKTERKFKCSDCNEECTTDDYIAKFCSSCLAGL